MSAREFWTMMAWTFGPIFLGLVMAVVSGLTIFFLLGCLGTLVSVGVQTLNELER